MPEVRDTQRTILYIEDDPIIPKRVVQLRGRRKHIHLLTAYTSKLGSSQALEPLPV